jgi:hypothetical protein
LAQRESRLAFKLASPNSGPREWFADYVYMELQQLFGALQQAGPDLTPVTLAKGMHARATSALGSFGTWGVGRDYFAPYVDGQISWWDSHATSAFDGKAGAWQACESGTWFPFGSRIAFGPQRTQLRCFGQ